MVNKKIFLILGVLLLPVIVGAQTLPTMAEAAADTAADVVTFIVIIMWLVTAVLFLLAQGDPGKLKTAKGALLASIAGTVIAILAHAAVNVVGDIFGI